MKTGNDDIELPLYQLEAVTMATKSFSFSSIIGEGGFGPVYKVHLLVFYLYKNQIKSLLFI